MFGGEVCLEPLSIGSQCGVHVIGPVLSYMYKVDIDSLTHLTRYVDQSMNTSYLLSVLHDSFDNTSSFKVATLCDYK